MKKWATIILALVVLCWTPVIVFASGVNSENKRRSVVYVPPNPSGDINKDDRIHISTLYRFIVPPSATNAGFLVEGNDMTYSYLFISVTDAAYDYAVHVTGTGNTFENCTFYNANGVALMVDESITLTNCIIEGDTQDIDIVVAKTVTAKNNCLHHSIDATNNIGDGTYTDVGAASVFALDPLFRLVGTNFRLQSTSPCVDVGFDTGIDVDYDSMPAPQGAGHDIGAFEYRESSSISMGMGFGITGHNPYRWND